MERGEIGIVVACGLLAMVGCKGPTSVTDVAANARVAIAVDGRGYHPATVRAPTRTEVALVFTRTSDDACAQTIVFPTLGIRRSLPLNQPVNIRVMAPGMFLAGIKVLSERSEELVFNCGTGLHRGVVLGRRDW